MKRIFQTILPILIIAGIAWFSYDYFKDNTEIKLEEIYAAVPEDSPFILEIKNIHNILEILNSNNDIHKSFLELNSYKEFFNNINHIDSIIRNNSNSSFNNFSQSIIITSGLSGKNNSNYLFFTQFSSKKILTEATNLLNLQFSHHREPEVKKYDGINIISLAFDSITNIFYATKDGFLLISKSRFLIESSIQQIDNSNNLMADEGFKKIQETSGKNSLLNLYINHKYIPDYLRLFFNKPYKSEINKLKDYSNWSEFDLTLKNKEIFLNGFSFTPDEDKYLSIFSHQQPISYTIENVLPENTSIFASFGISDINKFRDDLRNYQSHVHKLTVIEDKLSDIKSKYKINLEELIFPIIDNEVAYVLTEINSIDLKKNAYAVIKTQGRSVAEESMHKIISNHSQKKNRNISSYYTDFQIDNKVSYRVYEMPFPELGSLLFGDIFSGVECNSFAFIDNYIILGNTAQSVLDFYNYYRLNNNLYDDVDYLKFSSQLVGKSNFYFYSALARSANWFSHYLSSPEFSETDNLSLVFQDLHALSFQFSASNKDGIIINDIYLKHDPVFTGKPHTIWELGLDTATIFKPALVKNHNSGKKEIFVQDNGNKIYLINHVGNQLWEKKLDEPIISEIYQIDYYKNKKLQFLFNTANKIYIIDREGKFVERYPIPLNSPATAGLGLCDYDNNRDYRIFIPCENKKVYLYAKEGEIVDGWKFSESEHEVTSLVQHFMVDDKDFLVFTDKNKVYILNRKGRNRVKLKEKFPISKNGKIILDKIKPEKSSRMVITSPDGTIYFLDFKGEISNQKIKEFSENHFFDFQDVDGDGKRDFIFVDKNKLEVYNQNQKILIDYTFDTEINIRPVYYEFPGNQKKIGITSTSSNKIFLINSDGSLYEGFPLYGSTLFSIGSLNRNRKFNLFVGTNNKFLYNYEVK